MFDSSFIDPYIDPETGILTNNIDATTQGELDALERRYTWARRLQLEENPIAGNFGLQHLQDIHRHLFQEIYSWAGEIRTVDISKDSSTFIPAHYIRMAGKMHSVQYRPAS